VEGDCVVGLVSAHWMNGNESSVERRQRKMCLLAKAKGHVFLHHRFGSTLPSPV
jgi:hypothetical protein